MADGGITGTISDVVKEFADEAKSQTKQLLVGNSGQTPQPASQPVVGQPNEVAKQKQEIEKLQKIANLRQYLSKEAQKTSQNTEAYAKQEVTSTQTPPTPSLQPVSSSSNVGLQTVIAAKHAETKGNGPRE